MAISHTVTTTVNDGTSSPQQRTETFSSGSQLRISESVPNGSTDLAIAFAFTKTKLQYILIMADGTMTLETNSSSSPAETFSLTSTNYFVWRNTDPLVANPFSTNVSIIYATNSSGASVTLTILAIVDPT